MTTVRRLIASLAVVGMASSIVLAQPASDKKPVTKPSPTATPAQPPTKDKPADKPGATPAQPPAKDKPAAAPGQPSDAEQAAMMAAYAEAAKPGPMHAFLAKGVGTWDGKLKSFDDPSGPKESACSSVVTSIMGGRFFSSEVSGAEMFPGAGPFQGHGMCGYDNTVQKFVYFWVDNMGTGFMTGTGQLSTDQKTLTWTLSYNDPLTKKVSPMRQVDHYTGDNSFTMEMFGNGPDGKEAKMIEIAFTRRAK